MYILNLFNYNLIDSAVLQQHELNFISFMNFLIDCWIRWLKSLLHRSLSEKTTGAVMSRSSSPNSIELGVSGLGSSGSTGTCVSGRRLIWLCASKSAFRRTSSRGTTPLRLNSTMFFTECIRRSQAPPIHGECSGINLHRIPSYFAAYSQTVWKWIIEKMRYPKMLQFIILIIRSRQ